MDSVRYGFTPPTVHAFPQLETTPKKDRHADGSGTGGVHKSLSKAIAEACTGGKSENSASNCNPMSVSQFHL